MNSCFVCANKRDGETVCQKCYSLILQRAENYRVEIRDLKARVSKLSGILSVHNIDESNQKLSPEDL